MPHWKDRVHGYVWESHPYAIEYDAINVGASQGVVTHSAVLAWLGLSHGFEVVKTHFITAKSMVRIFNKIT